MQILIFMVTFENHKKLDLYLYKLFQKHFFCDSAGSCVTLKTTDATGINVCNSCRIQFKWKMLPIQIIKIITKTFVSDIHRKPCVTSQQWDIVFWAIHFLFLMHLHQPSTSESCKNLVFSIYQIQTFPSYGPTLTIWPWS